MILYKVAFNSFTFSIDNIISYYLVLPDGVKNINFLHQDGYYYHDFDNSYTTIIIDITRKSYSLNIANEYDLPSVVNYIIQSERNEKLNKLI